MYLGFLISDETLKYKYELPLGSIEGFVVDDSKHIFVGIGFYSVVQMYDSNGSFIRHWSVRKQTGGGAFNINLENGRFIRISAARGDNHVLFNQNGNVMESVKISGIYEKTKRESGIFNSADGDKYELQGLFSSRIAQIQPTDKTIIRQNPFLEMYKAPGVLLFWALGFLILYLTKGNMNIAFIITLCASFSLIISDFLHYFGH